MRELNYIRAGDLNRSVHIQQRTTAVDAAGGQLETWVTVRSCMAKISTTGMKEAFQSGQFSGQVTHVVTVRILPGGVELVPGMRVLYQSHTVTHTFAVQAVDNVRQMGVWANLMCLEIAGGQ